MVLSKQREIVIRLNADHKIGMGHLYRMLRLAKRLKELKYIPVFVMKENEVSEEIVRSWDCGALFSVNSELDEEFIIEKYLSKKAKPHLWIYDVLSTKAEWIRGLKKHFIPVVCFDDLEGGIKEKVLVINSIAGCWQKEEDKSSHQNVLTGPKYAIINTSKNALKNVREKITKIGVFFGGSDTHGTTLKVAQILKKISQSYIVNYYLGPQFIFEDKLKNELDGSKCQNYIYNNVDDLVGELAQMDLVICGGGVSLFEMCSVGQIVVAVANEKHEEQTIQYFSSYGACINAGSFHGKINKDIIKKSIFLNKEQCDKISLTASDLVDGNGLDRCVMACLNELTTKHKGFNL